MSKRKRPRLSRAAVKAALRAWLRDDLDDPYTTEAELCDMRRAINAALDVQEARRAR